MTCHSTRLPPVNFVLQLSRRSTKIVMPLDPTLVATLFLALETHPYIGGTYSLADDDRNAAALVLTFFSSWSYVVILA